ncbi:MAG: PucR family transcriptional regulator ligand-binding domain-containing protein [Bacillota bacterium]
MPVTVRQVLQLEPLAGARLLAGSSGLGRVIEHVDIIEVPDVESWIRSGSFLLTTAFAFRERTDELPGLVAHLARTGAAALGVKIGRFLANFPAEALACADQCGLPIIEVPVHLPYIDITTPIMTLIINEQAYRLRRSERVHRMLSDVILNGGGLNGIARAMAVLLRNPVVVLSCGLDVLAQEDAGSGANLDLGSMVAALRRAVTGQRWTTPSFLPSRIGLGGREAASAVVAPVPVNGSRCAYLAVFEAREEVPDTDWPALENAATAVALDLLQKRAVKESEERMAHDFIMDLLAGEPADEDLIRERATFFRWTISGPVAAIIVDIDDFATYFQELGDEDQMQELKRKVIAFTARAARQVHPGAITTAYSDGAVVLLPGLTGTAGPSGQEAGRLARVIHELLRRDLPRPTVTMGVGSACAGLAQVGQSFEEARRALDIGRLVGGKNAVHCYQELGIYRLICDFPDRGTLREMRDQVLGPLLDYDQQHRACLVGTLQAYLAADCSQKEAAARLHLHRNSLKYRLRLIEEQLGPGAMSGESLARLHLALAIHTVLLRLH